MASPQNIQRRYVTLEAGQKFVLPSNSSIVSISQRGGGLASSECTLPTPIPLKCYFFKWEGDGTSLTSFNILASLIIAGVEYPFNANGQTPDNVDNSSFVADSINNNIALNGVSRAFCTADANEKHQLWIAAPENLLPPELKVLDRMSTGDFFYYVKGLPNSDCPECQNYI